MTEASVTLSLVEFDQMREQIKIDKDFENKVDRMLKSLFRTDLKTALDDFDKLERAQNLSALRTAAFTGKL